MRLRYTDKEQETYLACPTEMCRERTVGRAGARCSRHGTHLVAPGFEDVEPILGRYRPIRQLAKGGFATILLAVDLKGDSHDDLVVIKRLRPEHQQPEKVSSRLRFRTEGELLVDFAGVPGVVRLIDDVEAGDERMLVLEYIDGISLSQCIERFHHLPPDKACRVILSFLVILSEVHRRGVVHRDLKPANVMITELGESPGDRTRLCLLDFGIAKRLEGDSRATVAVTQQGILLGTMCYMAPEQRMGQAADARSDVYSVGATMYHMLAGYPPFQGDPRDIARLPQDTVIPPVPQERLVPGEIERVLFRALHHDPDQRYQSADDMLHDLANTTAEPIPSLEGAASDLHQVIRSRPATPVPPPQAAEPSPTPPDDDALSVGASTVSTQLPGSLDLGSGFPLGLPSDRTPIALTVHVPTSRFVSEGHLIRVVGLALLTFALTVLAATLAAPSEGDPSAAITSTTKSPIASAPITGSGSPPALRQWVEAYRVGGGHVEISPPPVAAREQPPTSRPPASRGRRRGRAKPPRAKPGLPP